MTFSPWRRAICISGVHVGHLPVQVHRHERAHARAAGLAVHETVAAPLALAWR